MQPVLEKIAAREQLQLLGSKPLSGGDINAVFLLKCTSGAYVIKLNKSQAFPKMFEAEARGLHLLRESNSFIIPEVINHGDVEGDCYLLMQYIPSGSPVPDFWELFGRNLAKLHRSTQSNFGLDHDNYIGSLPQQNREHSTATEFYVKERLEPQFRMAQDRGFIFSELDTFYKNCSEAIPDEKPALVHGDLWSGNYLVSVNGQPVLIDPAVAFAPREMDLGMMHLFGGFPSEVFSAYHEIYPLVENWRERLPLWQLYYLLVHLNLFGSGYLSRVRSIVDSYT